MVIVIDDFAVDSNTVQPKAKPVVPPVTPLYDDNTMYNATVYPGKQVSAPSAAEQPVAYQAPIWESAAQTYRDPASGLLWLDDGTPGGQWVSDAAYAAKKAPALPPLSPAEDSYDLYNNWLTDSDAYWQMHNPNKVEDLMTQWGYGSDWKPQPIYGGDSPAPSDPLLYGSRAALKFASDTTGAQWDPQKSHYAEGGAADRLQYSGDWLPILQREPQQPDPWATPYTSTMGGPPNTSGAIGYTNPLYVGGSSAPPISADDPLYPTEANMRRWVEEWPYYTPETRAMLANIAWYEGGVDIAASGGGAYWPNSKDMAANRITDETMVHELAHAYYDNVLTDPDMRKGFVQDLKRLAAETDPAYSWPATLAKDYYLPAIGDANAWDAGGEQHGGLWSAVMGNIYQLPPYMWKYYSGMFDTSKFGPGDTQFRTGSGYDQIPTTYGPPLPGSPASQVPVQSFGVYSEPTYRGMNVVPLQKAANVQAP